MHKYALSEKGASDMIKAFVSVTISDLVLMVPISMLYFLVEDYMNGTLAGKGMFYLAMSDIDGTDRGHDIYSIQCDIPFHLCGKRSKTYHTG